MKTISDKCEEAIKWLEAEVHELVKSRTVLKLYKDAGGMLGGVADMGGIGGGAGRVGAGAGSSGAGPTIEEVD